MSYIVSIIKIRLSLTKFKKSYTKTKEIKCKKLIEVYKDVEEVLHHLMLIYFFKILHSGQIYCHYNNTSSRKFEIKMISNSIDRKFYLLTFFRDMKFYVYEYKICLTFSKVHYKVDENLYLIL